MLRFVARLWCDIAKNHHENMPGEGDRMKSETLTKLMLALIAMFLGIIAFRPVLTPAPVQAQSTVYPFYIEPGYQMLRAPDGSRQVWGKVVIDLRNGKVWGFPTTVEGVYPVNGVANKAPTSHPFVLGKFDFAETDK
jgi:hypothetical protein